MESNGKFEVAMAKSSLIDEILSDTLLHNLDKESNPDDSPTTINPERPASIDGVSVEWFQNDTDVFINFMVSNLAEKDVHVQFRSDKVGILLNGDGHRMPDSQVIHLSNSIDHFNCNCDVLDDKIQLRLRKLQPIFWTELQLSIDEKPLTTIVNKQDAERLVKQLDLVLKKENNQNDLKVQDDVFILTTDYNINNIDKPSAKKLLAKSSSFEDGTSGNNHRLEPTRPDIKECSESKESSIRMSSSSSKTDDEAVELSFKRSTIGTGSQSENTQDPSSEGLGLIDTNGNSRQHETQDETSYLEWISSPSDETLISIMKSQLSSDCEAEPSIETQLYEREGDDNGVVDWKYLLKRYRPTKKGSHLKVLNSKDKDNSSMLTIVPSSLYCSDVPPDELTFPKVSRKLFARVWLNEIEFAGKATASRLNLVEDISSDMSTVSNVPEAHEELTLEQEHLDSCLEKLERDFGLSWNLLKIFANQSDLRKARAEFQLKFKELKASGAKASTQLASSTELELEILIKKCYRIYKDAILRHKSHIRPWNTLLNAHQQLPYSRLEPSLALGERMPTPLIKLQFITEKLFGDRVQCEIFVKCEFLNPVTPGFLSYKLLASLLDFYHPEFNKRRDRFSVMCPESTYLACAQVMASLYEDNRTHLCANPPIVILKDNFPSPFASTSKTSRTHKKCEGTLDFEKDIKLLIQLGCKVFHCPSDETQIRDTDDWKQVSEKLNAANANLIMEICEKQFRTNTMRNAFVSMRELIEQTNGHADILVTDSETAEFLHEMILKSFKDINGAPCKIVAVPLTVSCSHYKSSHTYVSRMSKPPSIEDASFFIQLLIHHENLFCSIEGASLVYAAMDAIKHYHLRHIQNTKVVVLFPGVFTKLNDPSFYNHLTTVAIQRDEDSSWESPQRDFFHSWWWNFKISDLKWNSMLLCPAWKTIDEVLEILFTTSHEIIAMEIDDDTKKEVSPVAAIIKKNVILETYWKTKQETANLVTLRKVVPQNTKVCMTNVKEMSLKEVADVVEHFDYLIFLPRRCYQTHSRFTEQQPETASIQVIEYITENDVTGFKRKILKEQFGRLQLTSSILDM